MILDKNNSIKVLIVDDDLLDQEMLKEALTETELILVGVAADGEQAIAKTKSLKPDVILMDIMMPVMDGLEATRQIQELCPTPIVIVSAYDSKEYFEKAAEAGVTGYLTKPAGGDDIDRAVSIAIARHKDMMDLRKAKQTLQESEEKYKTLFDRESDAIFIYDPDTTNILEANSATSEMYGYDKDELIGMSCLKFSAEVKKSVSTIKRISKEGTLKVPYRLHKKKDGTIFPVDVSGFKITLAGKNFMFAVSKDITERMKTEETLKESEEKFRNLFNNAEIGIFRTRLDGSEILDMNDKFIEIFGYTREEMKGNPSVIHWVDSEERKEMVHRLTANGRITNFECRMFNKKGDVLICITSLKLYKNFGILEGSIIDITEKKKLEIERNKLETQLAQAQKMEAIGTLAGGIAHDFNNILGVIMGYTEMTLDELSDMNHVDNLQRVMRASERAEEMVHQILAFSRKDETDMAPVLIKKIIKEMVKFLRGTLPTIIEIKTDIDKNTGRVFANETQINQILMNLCNNAAYAMKKDGGTLEISLSDLEIDRDGTFDDINPGKYQLLQIEDSGTGIKNDILKKIFEPYFTTKKVGEGTGMGLSVVYGIVKSHHGHINVYSEIGKGTVFNVYLPLIITEDLKRSEKVEKTVISGQGERILFVDDEIELAELGVKMLKKLGYNVEFRVSSLEALKVFKADPDKFDLIVTDMTMPKMTGVKLASEVHKIKPDIPVVLCTGFSDSINKGNFKVQGINALIMKPVIKKDMAEAIREILDKKKK